MSVGESADALVVQLASTMESPLAGSKAELSVVWLGSMLELQQAGMKAVVSAGQLAGKMASN